MSEKRYVRVPVETWQVHHPVNGGTEWVAWLVFDKPIHPERLGSGLTEEEAFADLLKKLGYEEAK